MPKNSLKLLTKNKVKSRNLIKQDKYQKHENAQNKTKTPNKPKPRHIILNLQKTKGKEKIMKEVRGWGKKTSSVDKQGKEL